MLWEMHTIISVTKSMQDVMWHTAKYIDQYFEFVLCI